MQRIGGLEINDTFYFPGGDTLYKVVGNMKHDVLYVLDETPPPYTSPLKINENTHVEKA